MHLLALSMLQNYNKFETILVFWIYPIYSKFFAFILTFWRNGLSFQLRLFKKKKQGERITITSCRLCLTGASWFMCREVSLLAFLTVHAFCIMSHIVDIMNWFGSTSVDKKNHRQTFKKWFTEQFQLTRITHFSVCFSNIYDSILH